MRRWVCTVFWLRTDFRGDLGDWFCGRRRAIPFSSRSVSDSMPAGASGARSRAPVDPVATFPKLSLGRVAVGQRAAFLKGGGRALQLATARSRSPVLAERDAASVRGRGCLDRRPGVVSRRGGCQCLLRCVGGLHGMRAQRRQPRDRPRQRSAAEPPRPMPARQRQTASASAAAERKPGEEPSRVTRSRAAARSGPLLTSCRAQEEARSRGSGCPPRGGQQPRRPRPNGSCWSGTPAESKLSPGPWRAPPPLGAARLPSDLSRFPSPARACCPADAPLRCPRRAARPPAPASPAGGRSPPQRRGQQEEVVLPGRSRGPGRSARLAVSLRPRRTGPDRARRGRPGRSLEVAGELVVRRRGGGSTSAEIGFGCVGRPHDRIRERELGQGGRGNVSKP